MAPGAGGAFMNGLLGKLGNKKLSFIEEQTRAGTISTSMVRYLRELSASFAPVSNSAYSTIFNNEIFSVTQMMTTASAKSNATTNHQETQQQQQPISPLASRSNTNNNNNHNPPLVSFERSQEIISSDNNNQQQNNNIVITFDKIAQIATRNALIGVSLGRQPPPLQMFIHNLESLLSQQKQKRRQNLNNNNNNSYSNDQGSSLSQEALLPPPPSSSSPTSPLVFPNRKVQIDDTNDNNNKNTTTNNNNHLQLIPPPHVLSTLRDRVATAGRDDFASGSSLQTHQLHTLLQYQINSRVSALQQHQQQGTTTTTATVMTKNNNNSYGYSTTSNINSALASPTTPALFSGNNTMSLASPGLNNFLNGGTASSSPAQTGLKTNFTLTPHKPTSSKTK